MVFAAFCFAIMGAFAKLLSQRLTSLEVVFFRNIFGVMIILYMIYKTPLNQSGGKFWLLFFRGFIGFVALVAFFYNIANIPLAKAMTFSKTSPIFTAIFAYWFLKEKINIIGWLAIFIGFLGVLLVVNPFDLEIQKTDILGILSAIFAAIAYTSVRELRKYYDTRAIVLSFMSISAIGALILLIISQFYTNSNLDFLFGKFVMPEKIEWFYIIAMGIFATMAQFYMTKAYLVTKAGFVAVASYMNIVFSIFVGLILGDSFPKIITIAGICLIIFGGVIAAKSKE